MIKPVFTPFILLIALLATHSTSAQNWDQLLKAVAQDRGHTDHFGMAVSISGNYAAIGAHRCDEDEDDDNTMLDAGAVYLFEYHTSGVWYEAQKIVADDRNPSDFFGYSVALSGDYLVVGAYQDTRDSAGGNTLTGAGTAYFFERQLNGNWEQVKKVSASDRGDQDQFGWAVSIDGDRAAISARNDHDDMAGANPLPEAGSCYIFDRNQNGEWFETQKISASDRALGDQFGYSVSISNNQLVAGAHKNDFDAMGNDSTYDAGAAYVFERDMNGLWTETAKLADLHRDSADWFGHSVAISGDRVVVGTFYDDYDENGLNYAGSCGTASIFEKDMQGAWPLAQKIAPSDRSMFDHFGFSVSISGDNICIGAALDQHGLTSSNPLSSAGSAYIFKRDMNGAWNEVQKIVALDRAEFDYFGHSVSISGDNVIVGAYGEDHVTTQTTLYTAGAAYLFHGCAATNSSISPTACLSYTAPSGAVFTSSGSFQDIIENSAGCDSIITVDLTVNTVDTSLTVSLPTLTANATNATFQWIDCSDNSVVQGETNQSLNLPVGTYSVEVTQNNCVDTSRCVLVSSVGIEQLLNPNTSIHVQPNPVVNDLTILLDGPLPNNKIQLFAPDGHLLHEEQLSKGHTVLHMEEYAPGIYLLRIGNSVKRVVKQ